MFTCLFIKAGSVNLCPANPKRKHSLVLFPCFRRFDTSKLHNLSLPLNCFVMFLELRTGVHSILQRSEEHTSELQSLMRISYAVFCLKKKKNDKVHRTNNFH